MTKIIWAGGPHGVGKSSSLKLIASRNPSLEYLYLGRMFYETAEKKGFQWIELRDESKLLEVEEEVTKEMKNKVKESNLLIDCHFAIHFENGIKYPGFHSQNLKDIFYQNNTQKGVLNLTAEPEIIINRRINSQKKLRAYLTEKDRDTIKQEIADSKEYFNYFIEALKPNVMFKEIDTSKLSLEEVAYMIGRMYDGM